MIVVAPLRLAQCAKCPALTAIPYHTQLSTAKLCGICAGAKPGDPPQHYRLRLDLDTMRVQRRFGRYWLNVDSPAYRSNVTP